jgi:hypothetical protein
MRREGSGTRPRHLTTLILSLGVAATFMAACASHYYPPPPPPPPPPAPEPTPTPRLHPKPSESDEELNVRPVVEPIVVAAWAEPRRLPAGGGQAQILVRVQKRGGSRFPGVEVRLHASEGTLFSGGRTLVTDARGMTRDRLTTRETATVTLNAGGTRYRFQVPVGDDPLTPP